MSDLFDKFIKELYLMKESYERNLVEEVDWTCADYDSERNGYIKAYIRTLKKVIRKAEELKEKNSSIKNYLTYLGG
jgi:hypothetical protein